VRARREEDQEEEDQEEEDYIFTPAQSPQFQNGAEKRVWKRLWNVVDLGGSTSERWMETAKPIW